FSITGSTVILYVEFGLRPGRILFRSGTSHYHKAPEDEEKFVAHGVSGRFYLTTLMMISCRISVDELPAMSLNSPGSTMRCQSRSISESMYGVSANRTVVCPPGLRLTRSKPQRFFS